METSSTTAIDDLLDRAVEALNRGEISAAHELAQRVLAADARNPDAGHVLATSSIPEGEVRRLTIMFCDLVGSTEISGRLPPERYRRFMSFYETAVRQVLHERFGGEIVAHKGDGVLVLFGLPIPREHDAERSVHAALELLAELDRIAPSVERLTGERPTARIGIHRGIVFCDLANHDVYGLAANVAARVQSLAPPGTVAITSELCDLVVDQFTFTAQKPETVKGLEQPLETFLVVGEQPRRAARQRRHRTPLLGRDEQVERLRAHWQDASSGSRDPGVYLGIVGQPGIGKSRVADALAAEVEADGGAVVELSGSPFRTTVGLGAIQALVNDRCGFDREHGGGARLDRLSEVVREIGLDDPDHVPLLASLIGLPAEAGYEPVASDAPRLRSQVEETARRFVLGCTGDEAGLLVVDDAQWLDPASRAILAGLISGGPASLAIVVIARDPDALFHSAKRSVIELDPLDDDACRELLRRTRPDIDGAQLEAIATRSAGVPLLLESLGTDDEHDATVVTTPGAGSTDLPDAAYGRLLATLSADEETLDVASAVATIGPEVDEELLAEVVGTTTAEAYGLLEQALARGIIEILPGRTRRCRFRHELLRSVAYDLQSVEQRRERHGRTADALVRRGTENAVVDWHSVADHYERAGRTDAAMTSFERAAATARARGALGEAADLLGRAIDLLASLESGNVAVEVDLRLQRGAIHAAIEGNSSVAARGDYERCLELAMRDAFGDEMFSTLVALWSYFVSRGEFDRGTTVLDVLAPQIKKNHREFRAINTGGYGLIAWYSGRFGEARRLFEDALHDLGHQQRSEYSSIWTVPLDPLAIFHTYVAASNLLHGTTDDLDAHLAAARAEAAQLPFPQGPFSLAGSLSFEVWSWIEMGRLDRAAEAVEELHNCSERHGFDSWMLVAGTQRSVVSGLQLIESGDPDREVLATIASTVSQLIALWEAVDQWVFVPYYRFVAGVIFAAAGQTDAARTEFDRALDVSARTGMHFYDAEILRHRSRLAESDTARATELRQAFELARDQEGAPFALRAALDLHAVTGDAAAEVLAASEMFGDRSTFPGLVEARRILEAR